MTQSKKLSFDPFDQEEGGATEAVVLKILSYLPVENLGNISLVSKKWKSIVSDSGLRLLLLKLNVIGKEAWEKVVDLEAYDLKFTDVVDTQDLIPVLGDFFSLPIKGDAGFTLLTIPEGLSFSKLEQIDKNIKRAFSMISPAFRQDIKEQLSPISYTVLISNSVLKGSRNRSKSEQEKYLQGHGCEMPRVLDVATLLLMTFLTTEKRLYPTKPNIYTRCDRMVVGGFSSKGFEVRNDLTSEMVGVAYSKRIS